MAVCGSKKFCNKGVKTPYPSPILPNYELTILMTGQDDIYKGSEVAHSLVKLVMG